MPWSYLTSLAVYTFGALTFCVLAVSYVVQRPARGFGPFPAFTLVCAVAFVSNLLALAGWRQSAALTLISNLPTGLLPPLMLHIVWGSGGRRRRTILPAFYVIGAGSALARGLQEIGAHAIGAGEVLYMAPAGLMALAAGTALVFGRPQHRAVQVLLALMLILAAANLVNADPFVRQAPDYLVLAFFAANL